MILFGYRQPKSRLDFCRLDPIEYRKGRTKTSSQCRVYLSDLRALCTLKSIIFVTRKINFSKEEKLPILSWNIHGNLALKIRFADVYHLCEQNDIVYFYETWLCKGQETTLPLSPNFTIWASSRNSGNNTSGPHGGIAVLVQNGLQVSPSPFPPITDVLVVKLPDFFMVGAYMVPTSSEWWHWTDVDPLHSLECTLSLCQLQDSSKSIILLGDLNGCTASLNSFASDCLMTRWSMRGADGLLTSAMTTD